jgi:hypothetical protein
MTTQNATNDCTELSEGLYCEFNFCMKGKQVGIIINPTALYGDAQIGRNENFSDTLTNKKAPLTGGGGSRANISAL